MQKILSILTQYLILPLVIRLAEFLAGKLEKYFEQKKLKEQNELKDKMLKASQSAEDIKKNFENMP